MSAAIKLKATAGGSVSLQVDDTLTTDEEFNVSDGGIESGSNANGNWTKFPDGTLLMHGQDVPIDAASSGDTAVRWIWTYPMSIVGTNYVVTANATGNTAYNARVAISPQVSKDTTTTATLTFAGNESSGMENRYSGVLADFMFIGRWK